MEKRPWEGLGLAKFKINFISFCLASRVVLQRSPSSTFPTFYISISRWFKATLLGLDTSFEVPRPETWTGFQHSSFLSETNRQKNNIEEGGE